MILSATLKKIKFSLLFLFILSVLLISCNSEKTEKLSYSITTDTVELVHSKRITFFDIDEKRTNGLLYSIPSSNYFIEIADLKTGSGIGFIQLKDTVYKKIPLENVKGLYVQSPDSIFVQFEAGISIINSSGKSFYTRILNDLQSETYPEKLRINMANTMPVFFDPTLNGLFSMQYSGHYFFADPRYFEIPVEAVWDIKRDTFSDIPVYFPVKYKKSFYGDAIAFFRSHTDSLNIYSFMAEKDITVYNRYTGEVRTISLKNNIPLREMETIDTAYKFDMKVRIDHLITNDWFGKVLYDKYRNLYYRFISAKKPLEEDGKFTSLSDKVIYLAVYDEQFNLLDEINLGSEKLWFYSFVLENGLYILTKKLDFTKPSSDDETGMSFIFDIYQFQRTNSM